MSYDFTKLKTKRRDTEEWFKTEISTLRTGRATPALVENILVDSYGQKTPLKHVASVSVDDARTLRITPWDTSALRDIEVALASSNLGAQPIADEQFVRISLPALTEERRESLVKIIGEKLEQAKISLRLERDEVWKDIQEQEKNKEISEDDKFRLKDEMQKLIDDATGDLKKIADNKEQEIKN